MNNYYELLVSQSIRQPQKICLQLDAAGISYEEMLAYVDSLADIFLAQAKHSFHTGAILVLGQGIKEQLGGFLALQKAGWLPILLHHGLKAAEQQEIITKNQLQGLWEIKGDASELQLTDNVPMTHPEADVMGVLTSGSTGTPKVLYRTYYSWAGFFQEQNHVFQVDEHTRMFIQGSLSFTGNLNILASVLYAGGTMVATDYMHAHGWNRLLRKYRVNSMYMVPAKLQLLGTAAKEPYEELKLIITGSQLVSQHCREVLYRSFPQMRLLLYYGASELNYITYRFLNCKDELAVDNLGQPFKGIGLSIKNDVIYVDTPFHVSGVKRPFSCQDTGYINGAGDLIFQGRRSQWVNKGGYKISCLKLENQLKALPMVENVTVLPCEDELRGQEAAVFVVLQEESEQAEQDCRRAIRAAIDAREMPKYIRFISELPLNDRGKVDKDLLLYKLQ